MKVTFHPFSAEQETLITAAVRREQVKNDNRPSKVWFKAIDYDFVLRSILSGDTLCAVIDNQYLVAFNIGSPWYSQRELLVEEKLALRLGSGGNFNIVTDFLELLAKTHNASIVVVGSALAFSDRALHRLYSRRGYTQQSMELAKRVVL